MKKLAFFVCLLCFAAVASVHADSILYDNSTANSFNSFGSPLGLESGNIYSEDNSFAITSAATINEIMVGIWVPSGTTLTSLTGGIYTAQFAGGADLESISGAPTSSTLVQSGFDFDSYDLYKEYFDITSLNLSPGTYYLALLNGTASGAGQLAWDQSSNVNTSADEWVSFDSVIQNEYTDQSSLTFTLYGSGNGTSATPEPSSLLLLGSGLVALAGAILRKSRA